MMEEYYYISLKWTHKEDAFIRLWGPEDTGYYYDKDQVGRYKEVYPFEKEGDVKSVLCEIVDPLFVEIYLDYGVILPNIVGVRQKLGIRKQDFWKINHSSCPSTDWLREHPELFS